MFLSYISIAMPSGPGPLLAFPVSCDNVRICLEWMCKAKDCTLRITIYTYCCITYSAAHQQAIFYCRVLVSCSRVSDQLPVRLFSPSTGTDLTGRYRYVSVGTSSQRKQHDPCSYSSSSSVSPRRRERELNPSGIDAGIAQAIDVARIFFWWGFRRPSFYCCRAC